MGSRSAFIVPMTAGNRGSPGPERGKGGVAWREPLAGHTGRDMNPANLSTKRQWIAELARRHGAPRSVSADGRRMIDSYDQLRHRQRNSPAKNRMREICTSGTVGGEGGNILAYPAISCG